ncbi:hypothetical protein B0T17DRAFT_588872 [Bombardia bombarda]|uniref:F-box domain-containing protein n=1 Tax=Bombardia bombarda TaxID=252184 RepID=A0AA39X857_9PEZI|nr:hypothetical protein B0T17DRAFT_588872 [Bombardia bombarda]
MTQTLADLPDDVLLLVLASLESARDLRALALSCTRLHQLVRDDGWRVFVRNRFSSLSIPIPPNGSHGWKQMAESLTWQSRCWDKRSLQFQAFLPRSAPSRGPRTRQAPFQPVVDAHLDPETNQELVVWGAGENIVARYRERRGRGEPANITWHRSEGKDLGFTAGYDDVISISILKTRHQAGRAILTGRDNGDLSLLSAEPDRFGERLVHFHPTPEEHLQQDTINSLDVLNTSSKMLISAATKSGVLVYHLPEDDVSEVTPSTTYDLRTDVFDNSAAQLCRATWMGQGDVLALALKGCKDPLRYLSLTPSGWTHHSAAKNMDVERQFDIKYGNICPNSLQPVQPVAGSKGGTSLLLSAWRDGTCRLQDLRTPSPFDAVYQDNVDPWADMEALMTYGAERFVGGGMNGAAIKIFDFRWTKDYYHTSGLPCLDMDPFSRPAQPFLQPPVNTAKGRTRCDHVLGLPCSWHDLSRNIYYRPNASYFLSNALPRKFSSSGIWSFAKPSDFSPNFYIGISGGVIEASLGPSVSGEPSKNTMSDPNFGIKGWRIPGVGAYKRGYESIPLGASMMETGDGYAFQQNDRAIRFPWMWTPRTSMLDAGLFPSLRRHHRLDCRFQAAEDFCPEDVFSDGLHI